MGPKRSSSGKNTKLDGLVHCEKENLEESVCSCTYMYTVWLEEIIQYFSCSPKFIFLFKVKNSRR